MALVNKREGATPRKPKGLLCHRCMERFPMVTMGPNGKPWCFSCRGYPVPEPTPEDDAE